MNVADLERAVRSALLAARTDAGMSQRALAARLGRAHSFVAKIEGGTRRTTVPDFMLIAIAVGANPADLLARVVERGRKPSEGRQLVRENGRLVVAAMPGEPPLTSEDVERALQEGSPK